MDDSTPNGKDFPPSLASPPEFSSATPTLLQRFLALWSAPSRAFVPPRTHILFVLPLVLMVFVQCLDGYLLRDLYADQQASAMEKYLDKHPELGGEARASFEERMNKQESGAGMALGLAGRSAAVLLIGVLLPVALLHFGTNFGMGGKLRFVDALRVYAWSSLVTTVSGLLLVFVKSAQGTLEVHTGPAAFVSADSGLLYYALQSLDLFALYHLVPLTIGLAMASGVSRQKAGTLVAILWAAGFLVSLGLAALSLSMGFL